MLLIYQQDVTRANLSKGRDLWNVPHTDEHYRALRILKQNYLNAQGQNYRVLRLIPRIASYRNPDASVG